MNFAEETLGEICDRVGGVIRTGPFGSQLHASDYVPDGIPVIMPKNIVGGRVSTEDIARVRTEDALRLSQHALCRGDIVYGRRGDIGRHALITRREEDWLCGTGCLRVSLGDQVIYPEYLHYYLEQQPVIAWIANQAVGATMPNLNTEILRSVPVRYPHRVHQRRIVSILSAYDDLIENNLRRIAILEEMARAIYREWFVEFRYPGYERTQMTESELGLIPEEWQVAELRTVVTLIRNSTNPAKNPNARYAHYSIPAFDVNRLPAMELGSDIRSTKYIVGDDCVLVSKLNPRIPRVWLPFVHSEYLSISSTEFLVLSPIASVTRTFLYNLCLDDWFLNGLVTSAYGTSTSHQRVKPEHVMSTAIVLPPAGLIQRFTDMVQPMHELIYTLRKAVLRLREARDLLLPQLVSGELDVSNITIDAEEDNL